MPSTQTLERHKEAAKPRPEDKGELGYRVVNPDDPPEEQFLVSLDPEAQSKAEDILWNLRQKWLGEDD